MSPNAGLVRTFPQTSIKAPRKAGPSGGPRGVGIVTSDGLSQMSVAEMCGRRVCLAQRKGSTSKAAMKPTSGMRLALLRPRLSRPATALRRQAGDKLHALISVPRKDSGLGVCM